MMLKLTKMDVWAADFDDQPGGLARTLRAIADYGADLDCVVTRRHPDQPGKGVVYVTPLNGMGWLENASETGLRGASHFATLKIEGTNTPGMGARLTELIANAGVSIHGLTATVIGRRFVCYVGFETVEDMDRAVTALQPMTKRHWPHWPQKRAAEKIKVPA